MNSSPSTPSSKTADTANTTGQETHGLGRQAKLLLAALAVCALAALFWPRDGGTPQEQGGFLLDAQGRPAKLGPQLAPVSLIHFWATWCPPCVKETPALQNLARDFSNKKDFAIVMVAVQDTSDKVRRFLGPDADMVLFDPNWQVANRYGTNQLPETYLVVRGRTVQKFVGQTDWDDPALRAKITSYLGSGGSRTAELRHP